MQRDPSRKDRALLTAALRMVAWGGIAGCILPGPRLASATQPEEAVKTASAFFPARIVRIARDNVEKRAWAATMRERAVEAARPWAEMPDEELWGLMFGPTITRSWMVWSDGFCPACREGVPMYTWEIDAVERPWKVRCPHCGERFPKNDFAAFYRSGLDESGVFRPARADRSLLVNNDHPDANDPLHGFGVDDGEGYVEGANRWRFIGAYLVYGQWKQAVLGGIQALAEAYVVTGDPAYAHKAGVLLDRVADLYPAFDYKAQGLTYERRLSTGYVSVWHDACEETRELALAYDQVFEAILEDEELVAFLGGKARECGLENTKGSFRDVQTNIEDRILRDALRSPAKIQSNYPRAEIAGAVIKTVLAWPESRAEVMDMIDRMLAKATAVDGVTGEKGLANYSAFTIQSLALFLGSYARVEPAFLSELVERHPRLHETYRFHIDTWCCGRYYPLSGDTGWFAKAIDEYQGVRFQRLGVAPGYSHHDAMLSPSMFTFLWSLYRATGDPAFVQVLFLANDRSVEGLPHDLFAADPEGVREGVRETIAREGVSPKLGCVNKEGWHLAILRSGEGEDGWAAWLDYDSGGGHSHADGMNLGLFAKGLDLMPDFGYPPVQFGGWGSPKATWYTTTAAHNTVMVDGRNHVPAAGETTLWAAGRGFRAVRASGVKLLAGKQFERTVAMVDVSDGDGYLLDVFRVVGGTDHVKFQHSHFGRVETAGLALKPAEGYLRGLQMRDFQVDPAPSEGWRVDWKIDDRYGLLPPGSDVHLRYTDLTRGAEAAIGEGWVVAGADYSGGEEAWIPRVMVRRRSKEAPLASTFAAVVEPYESSSNIARVRRLTLATREGSRFGENHVAVEVALVDGRRDLLLAVDAEDPLGPAPSWRESGAVVVPERDVETDAELCFVRTGRDGRTRRIVLASGSYLRVGEARLGLKERTEFVEAEEVDGAWHVAGGTGDVVEKLPP